MEPRSLEELYRRYAGELYLYAYSLCQNRARAQDLTAEAFCRALLSLEGEGVQWRGWLFKVCRNLWLDELRRGKRLAPEPPDPERLPAEGDILEELIRQETRRTVYQAVQALSPADREVITLYYYGELSLKEVGAAMGISPRGGPHPAVPGAEETEDQIGGTAMTFRELLEKYRAGQASEEERALVEAELEKSEAIADYLAEQVEDELGTAETQASAGEVRHIQKKMNRRLRRTAVWAACIVLAVLLGVRFVASPLVASLYYQPNEKGFGTSIEGEPDTECEAIALDLTALYSLTAPGNTVNSVTARPEGFGRYILTYELRDWLTGETDQISGTLDASQTVGWVRTFGSNFALAAMESIADWGNLADGSNGQAAADYLAELPPTSYVAAWLHFPEDLSTQELFALEERYAWKEGFTFLWAGVRSGEELLPGLVGFNMSGAPFNSIAPSWEDYPMFNWYQMRAEGKYYSGAAYAQHFLSMLSFIAGRPQAENALAWGQNFSAVLDYVEEHGVQVCGVLVYAEAPDLVQMWERGDIDGISISTVLPSRYSAEGGQYSW